MSTAVSIAAEPNPFNAAVAISYGNGKGGIQTTKARNSRNAAPTLAIYGIHGRMVHRAFMPASGKYTWNPAGLPPGVYIARIYAGNRTLVKKLVLQR